MKRHFLLDIHPRIRKGRAAISGGNGLIILNKMRSFSLPNGGHCITIPDVEVVKSKLYRLQELSLLLNSLRTNSVAKDAPDRVNKDLGPINYPDLIVLKHLFISNLCEKKYLNTVTPNSDIFDFENIQQNLIPDVNSYFLC